MIIRGRRGRFTTSTAVHPEEVVHMRDEDDVVTHMTVVKPGTYDWMLDDMGNLTLVRDDG